jgi:hypothetical protein
MLRMDASASARRERASPPFTLGQLNGTFEGRMKLRLLALSLCLLSSVAAAQTPTRPSTAAGGKWRLATTRDVMTDTPIVTASLTAENTIEGWISGRTLPVLVVRCQTPGVKSSLPPILPVLPGLDFYVSTGMAASVENAEGKHQVLVRFDDAKAEQWGSEESNDHKALFFAPVYAAHVIPAHHVLAKAQRMLVRFTPFNANPLTITFDVRGFGAYEKPVLAACPVVDQSKWSFPPSMTAPLPTAGSSPTMADFLIGKTRDEVRAALGEPVTMTGEQWGYDTVRGERFFFVFRGGETVIDVSSRNFPMDGIRR